MIDILEGLPCFDKGDNLFSSTFGVTHVAGFAKAKARLDRLVAEEMQEAPPAFVIHDLRRTVRTGLSALPVPDLLRELVIAHAKPGLHKVYDQHAYLDEKRLALELWAGRLRDIISPAPENVVELRAKA